MVNDSFEEEAHPWGLSVHGVHLGESSARVVLGRKLFHKKKKNKKLSKVATGAARACRETS